MLDQLPLVLAAFAVGVLVGLSGVGGGAVMTPVLILFFGIAPVVAIATDLVFATVTKLVSSVVHIRGGNVDFKVARKLWQGSIPGVVIGILLLVYLASSFVVVLNFLLAGLLLVTAISMLLSIGTIAPSNHRLPVIGGGVIGFSVATTSVGAGALGMALLRTVMGDSNPKKLIGTDVVHAIPVALIAGVSYFAAGFLDLSLLGVLLLGSIPGVVIGSLLVSRVNAGYLRKLLAVVLLVAAIGVILKAVGVL